MTLEEAAVRAEWKETTQQLILRIGRLACAALVVRLPSGDEAIGTAFHVGEGVYLTARHVLDGNEVVSLILPLDGWLFRDELTVETRTLSSLNGRIHM
jgi:hypothetical protein